MNELQVPWFGTSVGGVGIIENGRKPNYMFRVQRTIVRSPSFWSLTVLRTKGGSKKIGILEVEDTAAGAFRRSRIFKAALKTHNLDPVSVDKVKVGDVDFTPQMQRASKAEAETILSLHQWSRNGQLVEGRSKIGYKPKVIGAWGLAGATFPSLAGPLANGVMVMQTFTFVNNRKPKAQALYKRLMARFPVKDAAGIPFPSYVGNTYDAVHLIALAIQKAASSEGPKCSPPLKTSASIKGSSRTTTIRSRQTTTKRSVRRTM